MKCPYCKNEIDQGSNFCPFCGKKLINQCPNCHQPLSPNDQFCPNCGTPIKKVSSKDNGYYVPLDQENQTNNNNNFQQYYDDIPDQGNFSKKKINWRPIIIGLLVILLLFGGSYYYLSTNTSNLTDILTQDETETDEEESLSSASDNDFITYTGNVNLEGLAQKDGDMVYMTNNSGYLVSFDASFQTSTVLLEEEVHYITPYEDVIYFADANYYLCSINKDGTNKQTLLEQAVYYIILKDDKLYYQLDPDSETIYVYDIDSGESTKINDSRSYFLNVTDQYIYYESTDGAYRIDLDGSDDTKIIDGDTYYLTYDDGKLYYIDSSYILNIYDIENNSVEQKSDLTFGSFIKSGDTIYAYTSSGIVAYDLTSDEYTVLYSSSIETFQVIGDYVLVNDGSSWTLINSSGTTYNLFEELSEDSYI